MVGMEGPIPQSNGLKNYPITHWCRNNRKVDNKVKFSLKGPDQILKARTEQEKYGAHII
jgi:hypothetical protein